MVVPWLAANGEGCWLGLPSLQSSSTLFYQFSDFPRPLGLLHVVLMSDREHNCPLVGTFEATGSIPGLGDDGEVRHMTDGGEGFTPESVCGDACQVSKLS